MLFRLLLGIDLLAALVAVYFFFVGLSDGSVSSFNIREWMIMLAAIAGIIGGGAALRRAGYVKSGNIVLAVLATPALLYVAFMAIVILSGELKHVLSVFGSERVMCGSDWCVCQLRCEYPDWLKAAEELTAELSVAGRARVFGGTVKGFY